MKRFLVLALLTVLTSACGGGGSVPAPDGDQSATDSTSTTGGSVTGDDSSPQDPPEKDPTPDPVSKIDLLSLNSADFIAQVFNTKNLVEPTQQFLQGSWTVRIFKSVLQGDHYVKVEQVTRQVIFEGAEMKATLNQNPLIEVFDLAPWFRYFPLNFNSDEILQLENDSVCDACVVVTKHLIPDGTTLYYDTTKQGQVQEGSETASEINNQYTLADFKLEFVVSSENENKSLEFKSSGISYGYCWQADVVGQGETPEDVKAELGAICDQQEQQGLLDSQAKSISLGKGEVNATLDYKQPMFWVINNGTPVMYFFIKN